MFLKPAVAALVLVLIFAAASCGSTPVGHHAKKTGPVTSSVTPPSSSQSASGPTGSTGTQGNTGSSGSGSGFAPPAQPSPWPSLPFSSYLPVWPTYSASATVNGCNPTTTSPPGPFGLCLDNAVPGFYCCSAGFLGWSDVVAGMTIDLKGAVALTKAGTPSAPDVLVMGPHGLRTLIPVTPDGAFQGEASFPTAGEYEIGLLYHGQPADLAGFEVGWKYVPAPGVETMASLFPDSANAWPTANHLFLAVLFGHPSTDAITIENLAGVPQPGAAAAFDGPVANAQGVATFRLLPQNAIITEPVMLGPGLYAQTYFDITPSATTGLTGFPPPLPGSPSPVPSAVRTLSGDGVTYYDVGDFLDDVGAFADSTGPLTWSSSGKTVTAYGSMGGAVINLTSGELDAATDGGAPKPFGLVTPLVKDGQLYLSLPDLIALGNAIAWAAPDGHGGFYFSDAIIY